MGKQFLNKRPAIIAMEEEANLLKKLNQITKNLSDMDGYCESLGKRGTMHSLSENLSPLDFAKLNATLAYSMTSLFHSYLSINHIVKEDHPVLKEIGRVKQYISKIKDSGEKVQAATPGDNRKSVIDTEAAKRLIAANLNADETQVDPAYGGQKKLQR